MQVYSKDPKTVAENFNLFFTSVGRNAAVTAESLANDNNVVLSNPLSNVITYPSDQLFSFPIRYLYRGSTYYHGYAK